MLRELVVGSVRDGTTVTDRTDCLVSWSFFTMVDGVRTGAFLIHIVPDRDDLQRLQRGPGQSDVYTDAKGLYAVAHVFTKMHLPYLFEKENDALAFAEELSERMGTKVETCAPIDFQRSLRTVGDLYSLASKHDVYLYIFMPVEHFVSEIAMEAKNV
jgi:hypothetical protein